MLERIKKSPELIVTTAAVLFFAVVFLNSDKWINAMTIGEFEIGPYVFPKAVCLISIALMLSVFTRQIKILKNGEALPKYDDNTEEPTYLIMVLFVASSFLYVWGMQKIGFILASVILLPVLLIIAGVRSPKKIILISLGLLVVAFLFFCVLLKLQLPRGKGIFKTISLLFY